MLVGVHVAGAGVLAEFLLQHRFSVVFPGETEERVELHA